MSSHETSHARVIPLRPAERYRPAREPLWRHIVGDVLRRERLAQERTLKEVADEARISMPYLSEVERGRKEASSEVLAAAARARAQALAELLTLAQDELARMAPARPVTPVAPVSQPGGERTATGGNHGPAAPTCLLTLAA